ncbi:MAG TPA: urate hydroxylase PuuD, partial [Acidimicrobiales bacterium]
MLFAVDGILSRSGLAFGFRWLHIIMAILWIGLLYYFNFVQVPGLAAYGDKAEARSVTVANIGKRALWYFRWSALLTFVFGLLITGATKDYYSGNFGSSSRGLAITTGMLLGTIMLLNVWGVIWRNQKVVIANAVNVLNGQPADPNAAAAGRRALMASRQNAIFSVAMVWFMVYTSHGPLTSIAELSGAKIGIYWLITIVLIAGLELNALGLMPWKFEANKGLNIIYD